MDTAATIVVKGLVQGVGFRYFVYINAVKLKLTGYVKNLYNGDVEIEVEGNRSLIEELMKDVTVGPRSAHVSDIMIEWKDPTHHYDQFSIK
ncbi:MAG: acylphosphatase [Bacteroidetes bacterium]|nr:MAG: acylphosphatase [Bacteroidota bacterium]